MGKEESNRRIENKVNALAQKHEFELQNGFRTQSHFDFQGGILKYHQWIALIVAIFLASIALLHQRGSFLYFYLAGLVKISKDTVETFLSFEKVSLSPLVYYILGGIAVIMVLTQIGYPIPDMTYGLIYNTNEVLP